MEAKLRKRFL